jgi:hypothetical protein
MRKVKGLDDGSNAWAFAPSRTKSGRAILMRNPHLQWSAGYYEAHMTVPGVMDFYGDFRIGGPFAVIGGFNRATLAGRRRTIRRIWISSTRSMLTRTNPIITCSMGVLKR